MNPALPDRPARPTWIEVDLDAIAHNVRELRAALPPGTELMAVVKADGYGHGALPVAREALAAGARWLGVAIAEEAIALREGLRGGAAPSDRAVGSPPILVMGYVPIEQAADLVEREIAVACYQIELARALSKAAAAAGKTARVHLKVDTGMGRLGVQPEEALAFARAVAALPGVQVEGLFTHFATADEADPSYTRWQSQRFAALSESFRRDGVQVPLWHAGNSAALIAHPDAAFGLVRAGISLYGLYPSEHARLAAARSGRADRLRPALAWKARLSHVKRVSAGAGLSYGCTYRPDRARWIGTVPVGYADGYSRRWSNRGVVLVRGRPVPIVGRVCMDQFLVDLDGVPDPVPTVGEEVVLLGRQGGAEITADDLARGLDTINYEIVSTVGRRVPRVYVRGGG